MERKGHDDCRIERFVITSSRRSNRQSKTKKESSDDETSTSRNDDEEYAMAIRNFKKFFRRKGKFVRKPREEKKSFRQRDEKKGKNDQKCFRCGDPNHLIGDCLKPPRNKDQKAFIGGSWSDGENEAEDKTNDETCLMAQSSNEVFLRTRLEPDEWIKDSGWSKHMTGNKSLFSTYKAYDKASASDAGAINERVNVTNTVGAYFVATNFYGGLGWNSHGHSEMDHSLRKSQRLSFQNHS
ncbi:zf-CCHC domain-containing protein [Tanacetum coccineum]|uniref:Zf-CCHC domain-containing protein n=1 Tax=Tanacetum coccineum TaxID=301880 RepID=A0ABQ5E5J9_9ASTR